MPFAHGHSAESVIISFAWKIDPAASLDLFRGDVEAELLLECASDGAADRMRLPVEGLDEA